MKVIPPIILNSTNITSTAPTSIDPPEWSNAGSYVVGNKTKVTTGTPKLEKIYQCTVDDPTSAFSPEVDVLRSQHKWVEIGATNQYAMFDLLRSTQTVNTSGQDIVVTLTPGQSVDSLACLGMTGVLNATVSAVRSSAPGTVVYGPRSFHLDLRFTTSWYTYFYGIFREKSSFILFDLPSQYSDLIITITFSGRDDLGVGACVVGTSADIGSTLNGIDISVLNFSTVDRDSFGNSLLIPRRNVPKTRQKIYFDKSRLSTIIDIKNALDATSAVWSGLDDELTDPYFDSLLILGFYRSFDFDISNPVGVFANIELEEI